jgi:hypothetical protein
VEREYPLAGATFGLALVAAIVAGWTGFWVVVALGVLTALTRRAH